MSREALRKMAPYQPGTTIEEVQRKFGFERIIKLASNENPLGSSPKAMAALRNLDRLHLYIDDAYPELRDVLAAPYGLRLDNVILGHGSNELINVIAQALIDPGDDVVVATPTFSLYRLVATLQGANIIEVPLREGVYDLEAMLAAVTPKTRLMFVCDPNNPTGTSVEFKSWQRFLEALPPNVCLVIDRAYREYMVDLPPSPTVAPLVVARPNTLILRTMSKIYGLASLRFGYGYGDRDLIEWLNRVRVPFNVSRPAALGARGALDDREFVRRSIELNEAGKAFLMPAFERLGLFVYPTQANFYALRVPVSATHAYEDFLQRGIIVRSGDALQLPHHLRITIGTQEQNQVVVDALEELVPQWSA